MSRHEYRSRREIQDSGWRINQRDVVAFNSGSETLQHVLCKTLAAHYLKQEKGFRVDSEVSHDQRGSIDIVAYGKKDEPPIAVECETSPTDEVIQDKLERYVHGTIFRDIFVLNVTAMPDSMMEAYEWVGEQL